MMGVRFGGFCTGNVQKYNANEKLQSICQKAARQARAHMERVAILSCTRDVGLSTFVFFSSVAETTLSMKHPKISILFWGSLHKAYYILGSILGSRYLEKLPGFPKFIGFGFITDKKMETTTIQNGMDKKLESTLYVARTFSEQHFALCWLVMRPKVRCQFLIAVQNSNISGEVGVPESPH